MEKVEKKSVFSTMKGKVSALTVTFGASIYASAMSKPVLAEGIKSADDALTKAGISKSADLTTGSDSLMGSMQELVYLIMGVGALWAVGWIVIGGMLLAGSNSNPQKRSGGLVAIAVACVGIYVIYKSYTIAGWAAAL